MKTDIKFSILVPVYKAEDYIVECIQSVLEQSYQNFELILVDDGSPDRSGTICDEYAAKDERIKVFHKANGGALQSRCFAVEKACGDYIVFLDSDDFLYGNALEVLHSRIAETGADCIFYGISWIKPEGTLHWPCHKFYCNRLICDKAEVLRPVMCDGTYNSICRKCVKASCFKGRDLSRMYHIRRGEDRLQSEEILENAESFLFIPDCLYFYRTNPGSVTQEQNYDGFRADFTVEESGHALLERLGLFTEEDYNRLRNHLLDALAVELKRISRYCSTGAERRASFDSIVTAPYFRRFLAIGYKSCSYVPDTYLSAGIRRHLNALLFILLKLRLYGPLSFVCRHVFKAR